MFRNSGAQSLFRIKPARSFLSAMLIASTLSVAGCGEPLSDLEKEVRQAQKDAAKARKKLAKMKKRHPERFIEDGRFQKQMIDEAIPPRDWETVKDYYLRLADLNIDLGTYTQDLELRLSDIVTALPAPQFKNNFLGYDALHAINPANSDYPEKAQHYKSKLLKQAKSRAAKLLAKHDKVENTTWYHHPNEPISSSAYLYIGRKDGGNPWLRLRGRYTSEYGWLFVNSITAWHDGEKSILLSGTFERRNTSRIWEWRDVSPTASQVKTMRALAEAKQSILRFEGDQRHVDVTLTRQNKQTIRDVLNAFEAMQTLQEYGEINTQE